MLVRGNDGILCVYVDGVAVTRSLNERLEGATCPVLASLLSRSGAGHANSLTNKSLMNKWALAVHWNL